MHSKHCYPPQAKLVKILGAGGGEEFSKAAIWRENIKLYDDK